MNGVLRTSSFGIGFAGVVVDESRFVTRFAAVDRQGRVEFEKIYPARVSGYQARSIIKGVG
jgi:hypothetical protein